MRPPNGERRPRRKGGASGDHSDEITTSVPLAADTVDALRAALRAFGADLELGVHHDRQPVAELVVDLGDGSEIVAHVSVRRAGAVAS